MTFDPISLPDQPAIEGLAFNFIRGEQDADAVQALRAACVERDQVDLLSTLEGLPAREEVHAVFARATAAGELDRRLVARIGEQVVAYTLIDPWYEQDGRWVYLILGWVLPAWRGRGLGTAMLRWGEAKARQLAAADHPGQPFEFAANASSSMPEATALLLNAGYFVGYTMLEMNLDPGAPLPELPLPAGIEVRPVLPEHYPLISLSMNESYRDNYANRRFQAAWSLEDSMARLREPGQDPTLWQIAWDGGRVVGDVIPRVQKGRGELHDVSVHPSWRRRGLARALLTRGLRALRARGVDDIRLNTVAEFPTRAMDLYRSLGFRVVKEFPRYRKSPE